MNGKTIPSRTVFISSTTIDLRQYRDVAQEVIKYLNETYSGRFSLHPSSMDVNPQSGVQYTDDGELCTARTVSCGWVAEAHWVITIVAWWYGFIPEGEQYSVTEFEYEEAIKDKSRKCFKFMPAGTEYEKWSERNNCIERVGETNAKLYQKAPVEEIDLQIYRGQMNTDKAIKFREKLRGGNTGAEVTLFVNINDFRDSLLKALQNAIEDVLHPKPSKESIEAIRLAGLVPFVSDYIEVVVTLCNVKKLHDGLHKIRQNSIRRWHEEVLPPWKEGKTIPLKVHNSAKTALFVEIRGIRDTYDIIEPEQQDAVKLINPIIGHFDEDDVRLELDNYDKFKEEIEDFESCLETAFSICNGQMFKLAKDLLNIHYQLSQKGHEATQSGSLTPPKQVILSNVLKRIEEQHDELQHILEQHNSWQDIHDALYRIDELRPSENKEISDSNSSSYKDFAKKIFRLKGRKEDVSQLLLFACHFLAIPELQQIHNIASANGKFLSPSEGERGQAILSLGEGLVMGQGAVTNEGISEELKCPLVAIQKPSPLCVRINPVKKDSSSCTNIRKVVVKLGEISTQPDVSAYAEMRKAFDDLFFLTDQNTLIKITGITNRCKEFSRDLKSAMRHLSN